MARAAPAINPPPPTGIIQASRSGTCSTISNPIVPCPAKMWGWSYLNTDTKITYKICLFTFPDNDKHTLDTNKN